MGGLRKATLEKIERDPSGCWIWHGARDEDGYGKAGNTSAHRFIYQRLIGPVDRTLELDHLCNNPPCVNPAHMEPVTSAENMRRRVLRQTHCKSGHEFTPSNTYLRTTGHRACRACGNAAQRRYQERKRGAA